MNAIRLRLLLALVILLGLAAFAMGWTTYRGVLSETENLFDYQLRQMALSLGDQGEIAPEQAQAFSDGQLDFVVQIWTVDGRAIYASRAHRELPARALLGFADVPTRGEVWRTFGVATRERVIQVAQPRSVRRALAVGAALRSVRPLLWVAPIAMLLAWWLSTLVLAPLQRVAADVRMRDAQSLAPLSRRDLPDEVAPLVDALNQLLARLAATLDTQRAFVADAAHELRSPLTALKLQLQLVRRAPDEASRNEAVQALSTGIDRSVRLVEQLLLLARADSNATQAGSGVVDLVDAAREAVAQSMPLAMQRHADVAVLGDPSVTVAGDRSLLVALIRNLLDNAIRYAGERPKIEMQVRNDAGRARLIIDDSGPGIPASERERVVDRFYRREGQAEEGSGLGLAIVQGIAQRHHAQLSLADSPLGGLRAELIFSPARQP